MSKVTIGVSIAVPEPMGSELQAKRASFGDDQAHAIPTHVTLLPPTEVGRAALPAVAAHLWQTSQAQRPFQVVLDGTDDFRPTSPVAFLRLVTGRQACERLQSAIRRGPLRRPLHFAYHPHVTVAHHVDDAALDRACAELRSYSASFEVASLALYWQDDEAVWRRARTFPFAGAGDGSGSGPDLERCVAAGAVGSGRVLS